MKRYVPGLHGARQNADTDLEGLFLVRVERACYRWHPQKPFFTLCLSVLEPMEYVGRTISGRLYSNPRALWKLSWFLRDFGYDTDLLGRDEVDERALRGLRGVVRISHTVLSGRRFLNLERCAPPVDWEQLAPMLVGTADRHESAHDV